MTRVVFELPPGVVGDDTTYSASGRYADGNNVRFWRGRAQVIGGWEKLVSTALTGVCRKIFGWTDNAANLNIAFGTHSALQVWLGGALYDITPSGLAAGAINGTGGAGYGTGAYSTGTYSSPSTADFFPRTWSLAAWGENLIASPRGGGIYTWTNATGSPAVAVANAPDTCNYVLVTPTRQVFALGTKEEVSGDFNQLCIRSSDIEDNTVWNTNFDTTAREYILSGGGRIVAGAMLGETMAVWTTSALYLGTFVGDIGQPWSFDKVADECGLAGPNAFVVVGQRAFWVGPNLQLYGYVLGDQPFIVDCPIRDDFAENMTASQTDKISAASNSFFDEIRFDYPDARDGVENSRYLAAHVPTLLNNPEQAWYRGVMARTAFVDAPPAPNSYPVATDPDGGVYWHDKGASADGSAFSWFIETADNFLDPNLIMQVRQVWPDFKDQIGPIGVDVVTRFFPQGDETTVAGSTMGPGDEKSDVRATGRLARVRFSGNSSPTQARMGNPTFDVVPTGQR